MGMMRVIFRAVVFILAGFAMSALSLSCDDPCTKLSHKICECERDEYTQQACIQRVDTIAERRDVSEREENCCAELIDQCTCDKLADGDLAACGIAQESDAGAESACIVRESE